MPTKKNPYQLTANVGLTRTNIKSTGDNWKIIKGSKL